MKDISKNEDKTFLFFDMKDISNLDGIELNVTSAQKYVHNPILPLGDLNEWDSVQARPWEGRSVIYDNEEGLFKCWYSGNNLLQKREWYIGYATSKDGVIWEKPNLGLYEFNGNKNNNICTDVHNISVIKDYEEKDPQKKYKMMSYMGWVYYSPDGINWNNSGKQIQFTEMSSNECPVDCIKLYCKADSPPEFNEAAWKSGNKNGCKALGDLVVFLKDYENPDPQKRYVMTWRPLVKSNKSGPEYVRASCMAFGTDEFNWKSGTKNPALDPVNSREHENHFMQIIPYRGNYIMLYECGWYVPNGYGSLGSYCGDIRLAFSRDGEKYQRVMPDQKVIQRGNYGEWDDGFIVISDKAVIKDNKIYIFYCGQGHDWTSWPGGNSSKNNYLTETTGGVRYSRMGLATLDIDRFTYLASQDNEIPGYVSTNPLNVKDLYNKTLTVNISEAIPRRNWLKVEVVAAASREVIAGFSKNDCIMLDKDNLELEVKWCGINYLNDISENQVILRFWLYGGVRLYSYSFKNRIKK